MPHDAVLVRHPDQRLLGRIADRQVLELRRGHLRAQHEHLESKADEGHGAHDRGDVVEGDPALDDEESIDCGEEEDAQVHGVGGDALHFRDVPQLENEGAAVHEDVQRQADEQRLPLHDGLVQVLLMLGGREPEALPEGEDLGVDGVCIHAVQKAVARGCGRQEGGGTLRIQRMCVACNTVPPLPPLALRFPCARRSPTPPEGTWPKRPRVML